MKMLPMEISARFYKRSHEAETLAANVIQMLYRRHLVWMQRLSYSILLHSFLHFLRESNCA